MIGQIWGKVWTKLHGQTQYTGIGWICMNCFNRNFLEGLIKWTWLYCTLPVFSSHNMLWLCLLHRLVGRPGNYLYVVGSYRMEEVIHTEGWRSLKNKISLIFILSLSYLTYLLKPWSDNRHFLTFYVTLGKSVR